jgi:hypothetical protein
MNHIADEIFDLVTTEVRQRLPELKGRSRFELSVMLGDLRLEIADALAKIDDFEEGD